MKRALMGTARLAVASLLLIGGACSALQKSPPPQDEIDLLPLEASTEALLDNVVASIQRAVADSVRAQGLIGQVQRIQVSLAAGDGAAARRAICDFIGSVGEVVASDAIARGEANLLLDLSGTILGEINFPPLCQTVGAQPGPGMLAVAAADACVRIDTSRAIGREQCNRVAEALLTQVRNTGLTMCGAKPYTCAPVNPNACPAPATCEKDVLPFLPKVPGLGQNQPQVQLMGPTFRQNDPRCARSPDGPHRCDVTAIWQCICSCTTETV